jgi:hypothetical protein
LKHKYDTQQDICLAKKITDDNLHMYSFWIVI